MSLFNLRNMVSKEDFADSHEPVNDGVKEVPNAQTIAASTKTADTGTDTNNAGPAKIIPEKEETGDATEKQFDTVSESKEKPAAASTPPAKPVEAKEPAGTTEDTPDAEAAPKPVDAPLEHETKEAAEDEQKKTETVTKSLESYSVHAARFDVVGYPKTERTKIQQRMNWLARRTDQPLNMNISVESISQMVAVGQARATALSHQVELHTQRKIALESIGDIPFISEAISEPVADSSIDNLAVDLADGITEREIDPLDVGIQNIDKVAETLEVLQSSQVALEKHMQIIKSAPYISQQAAAVLQAGLEHIDQVCGLKIRATGLEGYDTTPTSAMRKATISVESLNARAADIGAKIMAWIAKMLEIASVQWQKYHAGLTTMTSEARKVKEQIDGLKGAPSKDSLTLKTMGSMYLDNEFVGDKLHENVKRAPKFLKDQYAHLRNDFSSELIRVLNGGGDDILDQLKQIDLSSGGDNNLELPGGNTLGREGNAVVFTHHDEPKHPGAVEVSLDRTAMRRQLAECIKFLEDLGKKDTLDLIKGAQESVSKALIAFRKAGGKDLEESERQEIQTYVIGEVSKAFSVTAYFRTVGFLTKQAATVIRLHEAMAKAWGTGSEE